MISVQLTTKGFWNNDVEGYIILMTSDLESASHQLTLDTIEKQYYPHVRSLLKKHKFEGKRGQTYTLTAMHNEKLIEFIFVGLGDQKQIWHKELEYLRRALASALGVLKKNGLQSAAVTLPDHAPYKMSQEELAQQLTVTAFMATYEFTTYKTDKTDEWNSTLFIDVATAHEAAVAHGIKNGIIIGSAINDSRHWCDVPGNIMTPTRLSEEAKKVADRHGLPCIIFGADRAQELGMGAYLAVDAGSEQPGKIVIMEYRADEKAPVIALIGKGVTYDTGGISLKGASFMEGMHYDMSGAAAVIATMNIIAQLKPNVNVVGITPLVENMPSGKASRQDDIVRAMNGKTIEIKNTDAEGRLILADAMCYAEKFYKPDVMIDIATLTGACMRALGYFYSGLMTDNDYLLEQLPKLGEKTGDRVWPLPFDEDYKPANKSKVADISNSGSVRYHAGAITAAWFLRNFVEKTPWAHLDIAGTADSVPDINYLGKTSAGAGIRLLTEFVLNYKKN